MEITFASMWSERRPIVKQLKRLKEEFAFYGLPRSQVLCPRETKNLFTELHDLLIFATFAFYSEAECQLNFLLFQLAAGRSSDNGLLLLTECCSFLSRNVNSHRPFLPTNTESDFNIFKASLQTPWRMISISQFIIFEGRQNWRIISTMRGIID
jgi:hypothetical protein